ncbi:MAG: hypothetical protein Q7S74_01735 [Nanoarchaeota archaeon]|nr:hypothetical protein [Nanoarchaeota archaeon]
MNKQKRGEATMTFYIITIILAIAGVLAALWFLYILPLKQTSENEICHFSVINRATAPEAANNYIPLKCTTGKICFTTEGSKGRCTEFIGEKDVSLINLPSDNKKAASIIEGATASAMYDCWSNLGEGKLSLFSGGVEKQLNLEPQDLSCVICSRIAYNIPDEKRKEELLQKEVDLKEYMRTTKVPTKEITYLNAFTDKEVNSYPIVPGKEESIKKDNIEMLTSSNNQLSIVFTQIKPDSYTDALDKLGKTGAAVAGATFFSPVGSIAGAAGLPGVVVAGIGAGGVTIYSMLNVYEGQVAAAGYCGDFISTYDKAKQGCSAVQVVPYDFQTLNRICKRIEGNP